ncbi:MAG TPA: CbiX/SirB N-terminal domain-containing protein [Polyangia bacterium]|nr:CbiX/SirB N-terminal domain-containing protein [Polyangia bacterium]
MTERAAILIVGHGSREAEANAEFEALVAAYRAARPDLDVAHGYVELAQPSLEAALESLAARASLDGSANGDGAVSGDAASDGGVSGDRAGARRVVAVPLFLFAAGHVKNDLPLALDHARRRFPRVAFTAARALGVDPRLQSLLAARIAEHGAPSAGTAVIVVGRGASDPDANGDFCKLVRLFGEGRGFQQVAPSFIGITRPLVDETLELVARARPERVVVAPYFLFGGRLIAKLEAFVRAFRERYPWIPVEVARHLGADPLLFDLIDERVREALDGQAPLACDNCQYRLPMPGREQNVGGLRAMLWSLRHGFTHTQAVPHLHAHKPLAKHVLVCGNVDCADRGSVALVESLRRLLKDAGRERDIKITRTSCMGRCGEGPTVAVYPDGIWYRGVREADAGELVREHLLGDRLVARLVDNIMQ